MITHITIEGFKSIKHLQLEMRPINILIGANGAGKSNFISFFKLLRAIFNQRLQHYVLEQDKADTLLYFGRKNTKELFGKAIFSEGGYHNNAYWFRLVPTQEGGLFIEEEATGYNVDNDSLYHNYFTNRNLEESSIATSSRTRNVHLQNYLKELQVFHFHDTSASSSLRKGCDVEDNKFLKQDGANLPAYLYFLKLKHPIIFNRIEYTVKSVAPFFDHFILEPSRIRDHIELRWNEKEDPDSNFSPAQFSDGTLRFIALSTLLLQPEPPKVIVIDEPELGLHPFAITKLAGMIKAASSRTQLIVSTQSVNLVDQFEANDIIAVDRDEEEKQSVFKRLATDDFDQWIDSHAMGELWQRNIINAGQPFKK